MKNEEKAVVAAFKLKDFFGCFGKSYIVDSPSHTDETAPINIYDANFHLIAQRIKEKRKYRCDKCGTDFSSYRKFLHAHHVNGLKHDNSDGNIERRGRNKMLNDIFPMGSGRHSTSFYRRHRTLACRRLAFVATKTDVLIF